MMKSFKMGFVALAIVTVAAFGCKKEADGTDTAPTDTAVTQVTETEIPGTASPSDLSPMKAQGWVDDVTLGSELAADGTIVVGKTGDDFAPGQAVHIAMEVGDTPADTAIKIAWFGPGETRIADDTKTVATGQKYLNFSSGDTKGWAKGDYRAEVWVGDEKVNTQQFQIVDKDKAAM